MHSEIGNMIAPWNMPSHPASVSIVDRHTQRVSGCAIIDGQKASAILVWGTPLRLPASTCLKPPQPQKQNRIWIRLRVFWRPWCSLAANFIKCWLMPSRIPSDFDGINAEGRPPGLGPPPARSWAYPMGIPFRLHRSDFVPLETLELESRLHQIWCSLSLKKQMVSISNTIM